MHRDQSVYGKPRKNQCMWTDSVLVIHLHAAGMDTYLHLNEEPTGICIQQVFWGIAEQALKIALERNRAF